MSDLTIADLSPGARGRIARVEVIGEVIYRLMELGLVPGAHVELQQRAPLGGPLRLRLAEARLSLRREEAACFFVEVGATR